MSLNRSRVRSAIKTQLMERKFLVYVKTDLFSHGYMLSATLLIYSMIYK